MRTKLIALAAVAATAAAAGALGGCTSTIENRDPTGERFPTVVAEPLSGGEVTIPDDFDGAPLLLFVGYVQDSQFDIDRWLYGAIDADLDVTLREVPAARGAAASLAKGFIDSGMRKGIPKDEWSAVSTTYGKAAETIGTFTGTERPRNARVLLLGPSGVVRWFHDQGFSALKLKELEAALAGLASTAPEPDDTNE